MLDLQQLAPHGVNILLLGIVGFFLKRELNDIRTRIIRIENTYFTRNQEGG